MRTYGRTYDEYGNPTWIEVQTAPNGSNDLVYVTALAQVLKLNLGESPFYANWGIPAHPSVAQQVPPDYYVQLTQRRFAPHFASLIVTKAPGTNTLANPPTYYLSVTTHAGVTLNASVSVPT